MNSNKYILKTGFSQHLDILHWVNGAIAWACMGWRQGGCIRGSLHYTFLPSSLAAQCVCSLYKPTPGSPLICKDEYTLYPSDPLYQLGHQLYLKKKNGILCQLFWTSTYLKGVRQVDVIKGRTTCCIQQQVPDYWCYICRCSCGQLQLIHMHPSYWGTCNWYTVCRG